MTTRKWTLGLLIASIVFMSASAAAWDGYRVEYDYFERESGDRVQSVESMAFDCGNSECSTVDPFSGTYPYGTSTSNGEMTIDFPADLRTHGYAIFHVSPGYVPLEFRGDVQCKEGAGSECGPLTQERNFYKLQQCTSTIDSFSVTNDVYRNEPVVVDVDASLDSEVQSAFQDADTGVSYVPEGYKDQYYSARTNVTLEVTDSDGNVVYTDEVQRNIYMSEQDDVEFTWTPSQQGNHNVEVSTYVVDDQCASSETLSTGKEVDVQPERPQEEYYTIVNDLDIEDGYPQADMEQVFNFNKISNYAYEDYSKEAVGTEVNYSIVDGSGSTVFQDSRTLPANSNTMDPEWYSFNWTPPSQGSYTVEVSGRAVESLGDHPNTEDSISLTVDIAPEPTWDIHFAVNNGEGNVVDGATIEMGGQTVSTNATGEAIIQDLDEGDYTFNVSKTGYASKTDTLTVKSDSPHPIERSVTLQYNNTAPTVTDIPDIQMVADGENSDIDLDDYVEDSQSPDSEIDWSFSGNSQVGVSINSSTHVVTFDAPPAYSGTEAITFTAEDPAGATDSDSMTVTVTEDNSPPQISQIPDVSLDEDTTKREYINLRNYVSDPETSFNNLDVSIDVSSESCGVSLEDGEMDFAPETNFYGSCTVTVMAEDPLGAATSESFQVNVNAVNDAPKITSSPGTSITAFSEYYYQVHVEDPDDGAAAFSYSLTESPAEMQVSDGGAITWTPANEDAGLHNITVQVSDGQATDTQSYQLDVQSGPENEPPVANISVNVSDGSAPVTVNFDGSNSSDPDGTIEQYNWSFGEGGKASGVTANYTYTVPGVYTATLEVEDNSSSTDTASVEINVTGNNAPYFTSTPVTTATVDQEYTYDADAEDDDGDTLEYSLVESPSGMQIDNVTGQVTWTPSSSGNFDIQINVSDGMESASQVYSIDVEGDSSRGGGGSDDDDDSGSGGGGGGGGGGSYSGGGASYDTYFTSVSDEESLSDVFRFGNRRMNLELKPDTEREVRVNFTFNESSDVNVSEFNLTLDDNITEIMSAPKKIKENQSFIPVNFSTGEKGFYRGSLNVEWEKDTESLGVKAWVREEEEQRVHTAGGSLGYLIITRGFEEDFSYRIRLDEDSGQPQEVALTTRVKDSSGEILFEQSKNVEVEDFELERFDLGRELEPGTYTIEAQVNYGGETGLKTTEVTVGSQNSITGGFTSSASGIIQGVIDFFSGLF